MNTTILTADDDQGFRSMLRSLLRQDATITVVGEAENGDDAVRAARHLHPDIVLLDITMPQANGFDATRRIKAHRPETKVIILTVHANYEQVALENGADAFLAKKRLSSDLLRTIHALVKPVAPAAPQPADKAGAILVIDNDAEYRRSVADYLRKKMDAVIEESASSENDVLAKASTLRPNVVAVDWESSGAWIITCLRGLFPELGIIAMTRADSERHKKAIFAAGADASVAKNQFETSLLPIVIALAQNNAGNLAFGNRWEKM